MRSRDQMDLTIPYTFYPIALPHWIAWTLFVASRCSAGSRLVSSKGGDEVGREGFEPERWERWDC